MKPVSQTVVCFGCILGLNAATGGDSVPRSRAASNLIVNGGFEEAESTVYPGVGQGWETNDAQPHPEICSLDRTVRHSGRRSQKLAAHAEWDRGAVRQVTPYDSIQPGHTYRVTAWIRAEGVENPAGWYLLGLWWFSNDAWIGEMKMPKQDVLNFDWRKIEFDAVAPPSANRAAIFLTRHTDGTAWYDDIELVDTVLLPDPPIDGVEFR